MKRRRSLLFLILLIPMIFLWVRWGMPNRESDKDKENRDPLADFSHATARVASESNSLSAGPRDSERTGTIGGKLDIRDGEIGIVHLPPATMDYVISRMTPLLKDQNSKSIQGVVGIWAHKSMLEILQDKNVGRASVSESTQTSIANSEFSAKMEILELNDSNASVVIDIVDNGLKQKIGSTMRKGNVLVISSGEPKGGGYLFMVGASPKQEGGIKQ